MTADFTPLSAAIGGVFIGLSAAALLLAEGRVAGISGILGGLLHPRPGDLGWRLAFAAGLVTAGGLAGALAPQAVSAPTLGVPGLVLAGLLVGFGTRLGNGCTSGHGVCGVGRGSRRSLVSVLTFLTTGGLAAVAVHLARGGAA